METLTNKLGAYKIVQNMNTRTGLAQNQFVITFENGEIFQSYASTIVVRLNNGDTYIGEDFDYSRTTMKYLNQFLGESVGEVRKKIKSGEYKLID